MTVTDLGPVVARVGPLLSGGAGALNIVGHTVGLLAGLGICLPGAIALHLYTNGPESTTAMLSMGVAFLVVGILVIAFVIVSFIQYLRLSVTVHERGLVIGQPWFRTISVAWEDIARLSPPDQRGFLFHTFTLTHRSGASVVVSRLCLAQRSSLERGVHQHPDVQLVLEHHAAWLRTQVAHP